jgi:hypothetical protein
MLAATLIAVNLTANPSAQRPWLLPPMYFLIGHRKKSYDAGVTFFGGRVPFGAAEIQLGRETSFQMRLGGISAESEHGVLPSPEPVERGHRTNGRPRKRPFCLSRVEQQGMELESLEKSLELLISTQNLYQTPQRSPARQTCFSEREPKSKLDLPV